ncbi:MAG TPA: PHB depolymerase family esterase [Chitinophagales bacterium]|nr:PHB depolymerase family esterase [Chitinophagales bacterium]
MKLFYAVILLITSLLVVGPTLTVKAQSLVEVKNFGSNPGNLKMYTYTPPTLPTDKKAPLIVVLHGCLQSAGRVAAQSGWNKLADTYGFKIIYPQQKILNNPMKCFCWYRRNDIEKAQGESYSIKQMIDAAQKDNNIDTTQIFVTGLSAGAAMAVVMMSTYPEKINAGAIFAGGAYKTATNLWTAMLTFNGWRIKSPDKWGELVRAQNPGYTGAYPRMIIYQGNADVVVNKRNGSQLMKQWTNLHGLSTVPNERIKKFTGIKSIERNVYKSEDGTAAVLYYKVKHLGHALLVDPGQCPNQGGRRGAFSADKNYFSSYWTAVDFGLIKLTGIEGKNLVSRNEKNLTYTVTASSPESKFVWHFPKDCTVIENEGNNKLTLNWGAKTGNIDVTEYVGDKCKLPHPTLLVQIK